MASANFDRGRRRVALYIPFELILGLDRFRYEQPLGNRSQVIEQAIREFLEHHPDGDSSPETSTEGISS